jgi:thiamine-phosphate pyrophosphorylase
VSAGRAVVPRLYAIADLGMLGAERLTPAVVAMADAGVRWIQLRLKGASGALAHRLTAECCAALAGWPDVRLWLDDRADLAAMLPVGGLHLGQSDLPAAAARPLLPAAALVGASTHDREQARRAAADRAVDVVAVGPVFATRSKVGPDPVVGLALVRAARRVSDKPLVAIGGIDEENLGDVLRAGADSVAVLSAVCRGDVAKRCRALLAAAEAA